jgi:2-iminoacetate synthase
MRTDEILEKGREGNGLKAEETRFLFENLENFWDAFDIAADLKSEKKGDMAALYTCLYITNECLNDCGYCGYGKSNEDLERITLTSEQITEEAKVIKEQGVSNVILIGGTVPERKYKDLIIEGTRNLLELNLIPWIEFENLSPEILKEINEVGAGHFVLFQETYDKDKYEILHIRSPLKGDYDARLRKVDEALEAGFVNINIGALLGLNRNHSSEIVGLYNHAKDLQERGANVCISVPTLKPTPGYSSLNRISEKDLEKAYTVLRLALPNVSLSLSGRENMELRNKLFPIIDQIGTGGVTNPGGRTAHKEVYQKGERQFKLFDTRSPKEVTEYLTSKGIKVMHKVGWN